MRALSSIDMAEVTRLTRAGRLAEAMALLQGRPATVDPQAEAPRPDGNAREARTPASVLDMDAPTSPDGAWRAPDAGGVEVGPGAAPSSRRGGAQRAGFAGAFRALRERLPGLDGMPSLGGGSDASRRPRVPVPEGARFEERTFANEAGQRRYKVYVPSGCEGRACPVVVMLHGCTQSPDDFAAGTRMNDVAEEQTFLVVYPAQDRSANAQRCWNWFSPSDQRREGGEPALIAGITRAVIDEFAADSARVYVAGLSAGGAAASVLAVTHPDLFAAVGIHSGLPCGAAKDVPSAFAAMKSGAATGPRGSRVPTIVFHGDADRTVNPVNGDRIAAQAAHDAATNETVTEGRSPGEIAYTRTVRSDASGRAMLEHWVLHGVGHAWSGGSPAGSYTEPRGPDASREMVRFFLKHATAR
jgi:poly(hydroxyalkanoate) depolymerase family esterase